MIKTYIERTLLVYGCIALLAAILWFVIACTSSSAIPAGSNAVIAIWAIHGVALCVTFQRFVGHPSYWKPVVVPSSQKLKWARLLLAACIVLLLGSVGSYFIYAGRGNETAALKAIGCVLASMGIVSSMYMLVHWALRPENIFNKAFIKILTNPLSIFGLGSYK